MGKEKIIIELDFDTSSFTKDAAKLNKEISDLNKEQKQLKKSGEEGSIQFQKNSEALRSNKKELNETNKTISNLTTANKANAGSNEQLKAQLSLQTAEYGKLSKEQRTSSERGKELKAGISQTTDELKGNEEAVGDNRRSVGDYGKALKGTPFGSFIGGIKAMGAAMLANPIGIIIAALVGALALLKKAFSSSEEGQNKMAKATAIVSSIFNNLMDVVSNVANFLFDAFSNPQQAIKDFAKLVKENIINRFVGLLELIPQLGKAIGQLFSGDFAGAAATATDAVAKVALGVDGMTAKLQAASDALGEFAKEAAREADIAAKIADKRAKADVLERGLIVDKAKAQALVAEARRKSNDIDNVSASDRKAALVEAANLTDELSKKEEQAAQLRFDAIKEENTQSNSNKDAKNAEAQAEADLISIQTARANIQKGLLTDQKRVNNEIKKQQADRVKASQDILKKEIDSQKIQLQIFIESQGVRAKTLEENLKISEQVAAKELEILKGELDAKLISQEQFELAKLGIQNEQLQQQSEATIENAERELEILLEANQSKLDANQFLNDELLVQEQERLASKLAAELEFQALRLEQGAITEQEYNNAINVINEENDLANRALKDEQAIADQEKAIEDLALQREIDILNNEDSFALRQEDLDRQKAQELANAETTGADTNLINQKFALLDKKIDKEKFASKVAIASSTFGNLSEIAGKESAAGKAFAIAQATIDTYVGATAAFNSLASIPIVGTILGAIAAGAAVASGIGRVNKIKNTKPPKAAKGGVFGGNLHSQGGNKGYFEDGTVVEVEQGELFAVVNRNSTGMINNLSDLNEAGGGVSFGRGGTKSFLQDGGIGISNVSSGVESESNASSQIINAVESLPTPVVTVQDINEVQGDTAAVVDRANL